MTVPSPQPVYPVFPDWDPPKEDSEASPAATPGERALRLVEDVRTHPMSDDQAVALAQVYALIAIAEAVGRLPL